MRKVKNQKAVRQLAYKSMKKSRSRNLIAVIAIALTAMLFTSVFTIGSGAVESFQKQTMRQSGGDWHGSIKDITPEMYGKFSSHPLVKESSASMVMAEEVKNPEFLKRHMEIWYYPEEHYGHYFVEIIDGETPQEADQILVDEVSMELLGMKPEAGQRVTLDLKIKPDDTETVKRTFTVSGVTKADPAMNVGFSVVSQKYLTAYQSELTYTYEQDFARVGSVRMEVNFSNSLQIQKRLDQIITDSGYSVDETSQDYVASNGNWAYISDGMGTDPLVTGVLIGALMLIMLTGYLIIFNIFHISVLQDIRYYGLLKTIGTTGKQIKRMLRMQALILAAAGLPAGLVAGFFAGKAILPAVLNITIFSGESPSVSINPLIVTGAAVFTLLTIFISVMRPAKTASKISPLEAVRYTERKIALKSKKTTDGGKVWRMAFSNLGRNKRRTILVILSLSLSLILLNSVFTVTNSFDLDTFMSKFATTDFLIANAKYFGYDLYWGLSEETIGEENLTESFIKVCEELDGFQDGGRIYATGLIGLKKDSWEAPENVPKNEDGEYGSYFGAQFVQFSELDDDSYRTTFYGVDDYIIDKMEVWKGESDPEIIKEKLHSGGYVLSVIHTEDNGQPLEGSWMNQPGDKIKLTDETGRVWEVEVLALIKNNYSALTNRMSADFAYYTSSDVFKNMASEEFLMSYGFEAEDEKEDSIHALLETYTNYEEPLMHFESKKDVRDEFSGLKNLFTLVGGVLSGIIGLIGILNFINCILTGIITRRREFAMMEAVGMTKKQLTVMLITEGLFYAGITILFSVLIGSLLSLTAVRVLTGAMWFLNYQFIIVPMLLVFPLLLILGIIVPAVAYRTCQKESVVERMRTNE